MFKKFAKIEDKHERLEVYGLLKFNLTACLRLAEFLSLALLVAGLGWFIGRRALEMAQSSAAWWAASAGAILLMILILAAVRLPFLLALCRLNGAFGLDPRSEGCRLKNFINLGLRRGGTIWAVSMIAFATLVKLNLWPWTVVVFLLGTLLLVLGALFPHWWNPEKTRPPRPGELPPTLTAQIDRWAPKTGLGSDRILISETFSPFVRFPRLSGLGPTTRLIIQEKALAAFPPRELSVLVVTGIMDALVKGPVKFMLLRLCSLAVAVPLASILITTLGAAYWGWPETSNPALITLVWAAAWVGHYVAEFTIRLTSRGMTAQLAAAAAVVIKDETSLEAALATMAQKNLEEDDPTPWRDLFKFQYSRPAFIKRAKYHQHMSKFSE